MSNYDDDTKDLLNKLMAVKNDREFENFLRENTEIEMDFSKYFHKVIAAKGLKASEVICASGLDKKYPYQILNGTKKNPGRNKILCLCLGAQMDINETNRSLELTGNASLYPKNTKDAIIIKHINQKDFSVSNINNELYEYGVTDLLQ